MADAPRVHKAPVLREGTGCRDGRETVPVILAGWNAVPWGNDGDASLESLQSAFARRVHDYVRSVPPGRVATYGDVAWAAGAPRAARAVGRLMTVTPPGDPTPCHRVVRSDGTVADEELARALRAEGVAVDAGGRIAAFARLRWAQPGD